MNENCYEPDGLTFQQRDRCSLETAARGLLELKQALHQRTDDLSRTDRLCGF